MGEDIVWNLFPTLNGVNPPLDAVSSNCSDTPNCFSVPCCLKWMQVLKLTIPVHDINLKYSIANRQSIYLISWLTNCVVNTFGAHADEGSKSISPFLLQFKIFVIHPLSEV